VQMLGLHPIVFISLKTFNDDIGCFAYEKGEHD